MPIQPFADATNFGSHSSPSRSLARSTSAAGMSRLDSENGATVDLTRLVRERLQTLREENESQVNSAGLLGQGLLELRTKIESMMDELAEELSAAEDHSEDSHGAKAGNARIRDLSERIDAEIEELERQKHKLFSDITVHSIDMANGDLAQHSMHNLAETPSKATRSQTPSATSPPPQPSRPPLHKQAPHPGRPTAAPATPPLARQRLTPTSSTRSKPASSKRCAASRASSRSATTSASLSNAPTPSSKNSSTSTSPASSR